MYLLVLVLDKAYHLDQVLAKFPEIGITGATILDSMGVGGATLFGTDAPVIANLQQIFDNDRVTFNHTVISVVESKDILDKAVREISAIVNGFDKPNTGIMFTVKLDEVFGFKKKSPGIP
jgi:nitrogen regulatory protein P-II 1